MVLKNFLLSGEIPLLRALCPGNLYVAQTVAAEIKRMCHIYRRLHPHPTAVQMAYANRYDQASHTMSANGVVELSVLHGADVEAEAFLACLDREDRIDAGEIECLALAAYRGLTVYSDDLAFKLEVDRLNDGNSVCPPYGRSLPPHLPVIVHTTPWLLLKAIDDGHCAANQADDLYEEMRDEIGSRLPSGPLTGFRHAANSYW
jgi:hypothetical protein